MLRTPASLSGYPTSTWAGLPAAASAQGQIVRVTDLGAPSVGLLVFSDGLRWVPLGPQIFARSAVSASLTGTASETALATVTVPGGLLGLNGGLLINSSWSYTNSANTKTPRVRFGGLTIGTKYLDSGVTTSGNLSDARRIRNRNSATSQVGGFQAASLGGAGIGGGPLVTGAFDTTQSQDVVFSGQLTVTTETITLENYEVWITP